MASKKTWILVIVAVFGLTILAMAAVAGMGLYFVASHISTNRASDADALRSFDQIRDQFKDVQPLFELDKDEKPRVTRTLSELPTSTSRPKDLVIMAWDPSDERLAKITLPLWMLRLGHRNLEIQSDSGFDFNRLDLDVDELERVGPQLVFDFRTSDGERVLIWTR